MNSKNFNLETLLINLIVVLMYPILKCVSNNNSLLAFSDSCMIMSLVMFIIGIFYNLFLKGDFDISGYITERAFRKEKRDLDVYMEDQKAKREDSFNYPLLCAIILLIISIFTALAIK